MDVRVLAAADSAVLAQVAEDVFDEAISSSLTAEFLADPNHWICVAVEDGVVIGFASGVRYVHPDKPAELWINEVGVAPPFHRQGVGKAVVSRLLDHGREHGCGAAWVLTDADNAAARGLYAAAGGTESPAVMVSFDLAPKT